MKKRMNTIPSTALRQALNRCATRRMIQDRSTRREAFSGSRDFVDGDVQHKAAGRNAYCVDGAVHYV